MFCFLWSGVTLAQDCEERTTSGQVTLAIDGAESRFAARDKAGVLAFTEEATSAIPCLRDELGKALSARFHRVQGLRAFLDKDMEQATLWFAAARQVQPDAVLSESLVPAGHPLQSLYTTAAAPVDVESMPTPSDGRLRFDGSDISDRPLKRPTVFQYVNGAGVVQRSAVVQVGVPVPMDGIEMTSTPAARGRQSAPVARGNRVTGIVLMSTSGAALLTSGVAFIKAHSLKKQYQDLGAGARSAELKQLYNANRTWVAISGITGAVGVGLGVTAVFVGRW